MGRSIHDESQPVSGDLAYLESGTEPLTERVERQLTYCKEGTAGRLSPGSECNRPKESPVLRRRDIGLREIGRHGR
jgi:hypothetical protein